MLKLTNFEVNKALVAISPCKSLINSADMYISNALSRFKQNPCNTKCLAN